jgi:adenylate cyclase
MRNPARILAVDDMPENLEILRLRLEAKGYEIVMAPDGVEGIASAREHEPDLILLDIMLPKLDGISVLRLLKQDERLRSIPVILVTAKADVRDVVEGLDAGADDYLIKPFNHTELLARVRSMLRQKALYDTVQDQASRLRQQAAELLAWNETLNNRVKSQVAELERIGRLKRFLAVNFQEVVHSIGCREADVAKRQ